VFSGIVESVGRVQSIRTDETGARVGVEAGDLLAGAKLGDSIAINGACMTVVKIKGEVFEADISPESLRMTNLGELKTGILVNLERALALGDRLGGHMVSGHIDGIGRIQSRRVDGDSVFLVVAAPSEVMRYVVFKGSIAVDGISLTVAKCDADSFAIAIIPHTSACTTLIDKKDGSLVNIETDLIGKFVEKLLAPHLGAQAILSDIPLNKLREHGYA